MKKKREISQVQSSGQVPERSTLISWRYPNSLKTQHRTSWTLPLCRSVNPFGRFDRTPACDGQTDIRPLCISCYSSHYTGHQLWPLKFPLYLILYSSSVWLVRERRCQQSFTRTRDTKPCREHGWWCQQQVPEAQTQRTRTRQRQSTDNFAPLDQSVVPSLSRHLEYSPPADSGLLAACCRTSTTAKQ